MSRVMKKPKLVKNNNFMELTTNSNSYSAGFQSGEKSYAVMKEQMIYHAEARAKALLKEGQRRCEDIISSAEAEANKIKEKAFKTGYEDGIKKAEADADILLQEAENKLIDAVAEKEAILNSAEADVLALALTIAERIIKTKFEQEKDLALCILRGIHWEKTYNSITIKANRETISYLEKKKKELDFILPHAQYRLETDLSMGEGLVVETEYGVMDCTVGEQLKQILYKLGESLVEDGQ